MDHYFNKKYLLLLLVLIATGNVIRGMERLLQENSNNSLVPELPNELWFLISQKLIGDSKECTKKKIETIAKLSLVNKNFNALNDFTVLLSKEKNLLPGLASSCLQSSRTMGENFYNFVLSKSVIENVLSLASFKDFIGQEPENWFAKQKPDKRNEELYRRLYSLALFFKACCVVNKSFSEICKPYDHAQLITEQNISAWIKAYCCHAPKLYSMYNQITDYTKIHECGWARPATLLNHWMISYMLQFFPDDKLPLNTTGRDEFGQTALIAACRLGNTPKVEEILTPNIMEAKNQLSAKDILGYNAWIISIINHDYKTMDVLFKHVAKAKAMSAPDINQLVTTALYHNNNYALQKLLDTFYNPIPSWQNSMPLSTNSKKFLEQAIVLVARIPSDNIKAYEILLKHGVSPYTKCTFCKLPISEIADQGGKKKEQYIKDYIQYKRWLEKK